MWKPVTIKPNDQSLCGRRIRSVCLDERADILYVGATSFFVLELKTNQESAWDFTCFDFEIWEEPKPKKLLAPAFVRSGCDGFSVTGKLHSSFEEAKTFWGEALHSWPATINVNGYYEVPE